MLSDPNWSLKLDAGVWSLLHKGVLVWTGTNPDDGMSALASHEFRMACGEQS